MSFINQMEPSFNEDEIKSLVEYMNQGGWVTEFKKTRTFEKMIAEFTGSRYCSVVCNGTASLIVALLASEIKRGDEILVPDYTMVATPNAVELLGARAVFVDIKRESLCMDFELMKDSVTDKTRGVILVTINGRHPDNLEQFVTFCKERNICLIEDAAQSFGSKSNNRYLGTFGDIGCFSFSSPKIITTGQGGALITNNEKLFKRIQSIRDFGRAKEGEGHYVAKGWNFKFTDIQAIIGIAQIKKIEWRIKRKKEIGLLYENLLQDVSLVEFIPTDYKNTVPWFFDILVENRESLMNFLKNNGIITRAFYRPLHSEPVYNYQGHFPVTEEISSKGLWLPSSVKLTDHEIYYISDKIRKFYSQRNA